MKAEILHSHSISHSDILQILKLNQESTGDRSFLRNEQDFQWLTNENPAGPAILPVVRDDRDQIIASIVILPLIFSGPQGEFKGATAPNLIIAPEHRGGLAYTLLMRQFHKAFRNENIPYHYSFISDEAYQRQKKLSPQSVDTIPALVRIPLSSPITHKLKTLFSTSNQKSPNLKITQTTPDQLNADSLHTAPKAPTIKRSNAYLRWRFNPKSNHPYWTLAAHEGETLVAYLIASRITFKGRKVGLIHDLQVAHDRLGTQELYALTKHLQSILTQNGILLCTTFASKQSRSYTLLKKCGFHPIPTRVHNKKLGIFTHSKNSTDTPKIDASNWHINLFD